MLGLTRCNLLSLHLGNKKNKKSTKEIYEMFITFFFFLGRSANAKFGIHHRFRFLVGDILKIKKLCDHLPCKLEFFFFFSSLAM